MRASAPSPPALGRPASSPGTLPEPQVRAMFDRIAGVYDRMNAVMTAGLHHRWRARAADRSRVGPGDRVLDVATGTGDLALELARRVAPGGAVTGVDFSDAMLALASEKGTAARGDGSLPADVELYFEPANALALPYDDASFDAATVGFGARNFSDLERGLAEMARVVRPAGRVVVLEITAPTGPPLSTFLDLWFDRLVPVLGRLAGDAAAYSYLPSSVRRFPGPESLAAIMWQVGLRSVSYTITAGGIIALHVGEVVAAGRVTPPPAVASQPDDAAAARHGEPGRRAGGSAAGERGQA